MTSTTPPPSSSRGRSATTGTTTTTTTTSTQRPRDTRYPTPPPPHNPLGPAAQFPYLPAKSEYGGPDIYYSCRPGGACLYDLLNTLPLEPYGVLAWEILDREDEIFDSDNVKDEYKMLVVNRLITGAEVASLLKHYESLTGMDTWYN
ncbi:hypothetical protein C0993_006203 [Termitomyces sp. T159_Od127]|nr:hypothetical protein C0993_006203 [Termitomyces sp. T159_Od127]